MKNIINPLDFGSKIEYASKLTKREYFAGLAMQGIIASGNYSELEVASCAVNLADELLNQLEND